MAAEKSGKPKRNKINSQQSAFVKAYAKSKTLKDAAIEAGYSHKNAAQSGFQALKQIRGKVPELMDELGLTDRALIENYLKPLLDAQETKFFNEGKKRINVAALGIRHTALDTAFKLRGSYAPRDPKEAEQFGVKVIVVDVARPIRPPLPPRGKPPAREAINVTPLKLGNSGKPPSDNNGHD